MADLRKRLPENIAGEFFVDSTCIDCDTCRQLAPEVFTETEDYSVVHHQPESPAEHRHVLQALIACPTGSIGTIEKVDTSRVREDFPMLIEGTVFYNGFASPKSYGGSSYFVRHPDGNWLIDSPKYMPHLAEKFEAMGGVRYIFLTHRDDVADAHRYAERFSSERIIHRFELSAQPDAERVIEGNTPILFSPEFIIIPTPGHTRGHCALLYKNAFLFTGDHLWWSRNRHALSASRSVCWYSWPEQVKSVERLLDYQFNWILPGHGERIHLDPSVMHDEVIKLVDRITGTR